MGDGNLQVLESTFADDAVLRHQMLGEITGKKSIMALLTHTTDDRIAAHYVAASIRITPSESDTVHADWDLSYSWLYPVNGKNEVWQAAFRIAATFRRVSGEWRIGDHTMTELYMDAGMTRFVATALAKQKG